MTIKSLIALACALTAAAGAHAANQLQASMTLVGPDGTGKPIGVVTITESKSGLVFTPNLTNLPPGSHGYHVHEMASCGTSEKDGKKVPAGAAGGHYDPTGAKHHAGPSGDGHLGGTLEPLDAIPDVVHPAGQAGAVVDLDAGGHRVRSNLGAVGERVGHVGDQR